MRICMHRHTHTHKITMNEEETKNLKDNGEGYIEGFGGRKGKGEML